MTCAEGLFNLFAVFQTQQGDACSFQSSWCDMKLLLFMASENHGGLHKWNIALAYLNCKSYNSKRLMRF